MKKDSIQYCVYCGTENKIDDKKCIKCHKKLNPKERPLLDYMKGKISDELSGKVEENVISIITNFIKSHLYGFVLSCSVIVSTLCVVTNIVKTPDVTEVTEKPMITEFTYIGEGMTALEVAKTYINALDEGDIKTVKSLQLERFYPNIIKDLEEYALNNADAYELPVLEYNMVDNREILFRSNINKAYVGRDEMVMIPEGYYGQYHYLAFYVSIPYCSYNTCREEDGTVVYDYRATEEIQLIEIDGNYYVLGEKVGVIMSVDTAIKRKALFIAGGDTSNLSFDKVMEDFDNCNSDEKCLEDLGYTDLYSN